MFNRNIVFGSIDLLIIIVVVLSFYILVFNKTTSETTDQSGNDLNIPILDIHPFDIVSDFPISEKGNLNFIFIKVLSDRLFVFTIVGGEVKDNRFFIKPTDFDRWWNSFQPKSLGERTAKSKLLIYEEKSNDQVIAYLLRFSFINGLSNNYVDAIK